jgi:S-methylmethionine-dependent homocysteine/selenocysteine methylase
MKSLNCSKPLLLDGGMGRELRFRGIDILKPSWSAGALLSHPEVVVQTHLDYIKAGANIITTNTYGVIHKDLSRENKGHLFEELNIKACMLAGRAREMSGKKIYIAGSLPPLHGSFRPDLVKTSPEIFPLYEQQAKLLAPHVDLFLCETMSTICEARTAASAACQFQKPVWVSWTLHEDCPGCLRSGETIREAAKALADLPVSGVLANCCTPESVTQAMPDLVDAGFDYAGGYANTFVPIPKDWTLDGDRAIDGLLDLRRDLSPEEYGVYAVDWLKKGASVIGGCCGTGPDHIKKLRQIIDAKAGLF